MNNLDKSSQADHVRLNVRIPGDKLAINAVDRMDEMSRIVHHPKTVIDCEQALYALIISSFLS